jgi:Domain of unknown function (DUF1814).
MALERRLRDEAFRSGTPLVRLRKTIAFDRLLARLVTAEPDGWMLKGGLALQLRLPGRSRSTKDVDVLLRSAPTEAYSVVARAAELDLDDFFILEIARPASLGDNRGMRLTVQSRLDGRIFEQFHVDVAFEDPVVEPVSRLPFTDLLEFAGVPRVFVPCYPISQQVAEKLHALTLPRGSQENSRVKDLVDLALIAETSPPSVEAITAAVRATFSSRRTHEVPPDIPDPPPGWDVPYSRLAREVGLGAAGLLDGLDRKSVV